MTEQNLLSKALSNTAREARLRAGLTQDDVAERLDLSQEVYGRIERGALLPSVLTLRRLSLVLHVPTDQLLGIDSALTHSPPSERDSPQLKRLIRSLRELSASRLRTLGLLIAHFRRRD
ncbi:MAG TPA: helix-turn-helix transcriptional regulator [Archangium sp.]|uniref:helix-turn-helix transcriptional regulator n=1 Tax=Archangium sp. TaxID=1872627 RepID=UPI002E316597|nr:helix-turn-helix transcriptional regulator [Archangium sp.]HEX5753046.1 helix-turn-helix transcriptional regulator [Archangium sp.]